MKIRYTLNTDTAIARRQKCISNYMTKFYNLYADRRRAVENIDERQLNFIMLQLWEIGKVAAIKTEGIITYVPFAPSKWDVYDYPTNARPLKRKAVPFIPDREMEIGKDMIIMYANKAHRPIREQVEFYVDKIVSIEELIDMNVTALKMPYLFATSPENREKFKRIWERIQLGEPALFIDIDDVNAFKIMLSGSNFILDQLFQAKKDRENEVLTLLGVDNVDVQKKEHLIVDEANANNNLINDNGDTYQDAIDDFFSEIENALGIRVVTERKQCEVQSEKEGGDENADEHDEGNE